MQQVQRLWGQQIRERRLELGFTMAELAAMVDCSLSAISRYESGTRGVSDAMKARIALALQVPINELFAFPEAA